MSPRGKSEDWDLEAGLPDDLDGYVQGAKFGFLEDYQAKGGLSGSEGVLLILPLVSADGEEIGNTAYSVGSGWVVVKGGREIEHPTRRGIVRSSRYGRLIDRVVSELGVPMEDFGTPRQAVTWEGQGFHWNQEQHKTVSGETRNSLMPTSYLEKLGARVQRKTSRTGAGVRGAPQVEEEEGEAPAPRPAAKRPSPAPYAPSGVEKTLAGLAKNLDFATFVQRALQLKEVAGNDELVARVVDEDNGIWSECQ